MPALSFDPVETRVSPALTPADARGAALTPAIGQQLEHVGQEGSRVAGDLNRIEWMRNQYDELSRASKLAGDARIQFTNRFHELSAQYNDTNGDGFHNKLLGEIQDYADAGQGQFTNPRAKAAFSEHMSSIASTFTDHAINWEFNQAQIYRESNLQDGLRGSIDAVSRDPSQFDGALQENLKAINDIPGDLNPLAPATKMRLKNQVINQLTEAAGLKWAQTYPLQTRNAILGVTQQAPSSMSGKIVAAVDSSPEAKKAGLDANTALAVAHAENPAFDPTVPNAAGTSAKGLFQITDDTWSYLGGTSDNRGDPQAQAELGVKNLAANTRALRDTIKRQPTPGEVYSTQWGLGFAGALAKAPDNEPVQSIFAQVGIKDPESAAIKNNVVNMTAGQLRTHFETMMRDDMAKTAGLAVQPKQGEDAQPAPSDPSWLKYATGPQRQAILTHAETAMHKRDEDMRVMVEGQVKDFSTAMSYGQQAYRPTMEMLSAAYGPRALAINQQLDSMQRYGAARAQLQIVPSAQVQPIVDSFKPDANSSALDRINYESMQTVARNLLDQRKAQPLEMAAQSGVYNIPPLDFTDLNKFPDQLRQRASVAAQVSRDFGTPFRMATDEEASRMSSYIQGGTVPQVSDFLGKIKQGSPDTRSYMATLGQIAPSQTVPAVVGSIMLKQNPMTFPGGWFSAGETQKQGDVAMTMLDGWRAQNPVVKKEGKELDLPNETEFKNEFAAKVGNTFGADAQSYAAAYEAAKAYYVGAAMKTNGLGKDWTHDTQSLFDRGIQAATGGIIDYNGRGKIALPWGMPEDTFRNTMAARIPDAVKNSGLDPKDYPASSQQLTTIGDGRYRLYNGTSPIMSKDGKFVDIDLNNQGATQQPPPDLSLQDIDIGRKMMAPPVRRGR